MLYMSARSKENGGRINAPIYESAQDCAIMDKIAANDMTTLKETTLDPPKDVERTAGSFHSSCGLKRNKP